MIEAKVCLMGVINVFQRTYILSLSNYLLLRNIYIITSQITLFVQKRNNENSSDE